MGQFIYRDGISTPLGWFQLEATDRGLCRAGWWPDKLPSTARNSILDHAISEAEAYFSGQLKFFQTPLDPIGTDFQQMVWQTLGQIPYGQTWSYAELAQFKNQPKAIRAMAAANGKNPLMLFIPCHRVVGSGGGLVGYAGGLDRKKWLLEWEQRDYRLFP